MSKTIVKVDDEESELYKPPSEGTELVKNQTEEIERQVNYDLISAQTSVLSLALRIAYLGVTKFPRIQVKINALSVDVTKLSDEAVRVMQKFQRAAAMINQSYISACKYMSRKKERYALMEFQNVFKKATEMQEAVSKLATDFGTSSTNAQTIYDEVQGEIQVRDDATAAESTIRKEMAAIEGNIDKTEALYNDALKRENEARDRVGSIGRRILSNITLTFVGGSDKEDFEKCYAERMKLQDDLRALRIEHQKKLLEMLEESAKLKPHEGTEIKLEHSTLTALDCCVKGMRHSQSTLLSISEFWKRVSDMNKDFSPEQIEIQIKTIKEEDPNDAEARYEEYNSDEFREKIKRQQAAWVAMAVANARCLDCINTANRELHLFLGEHYAPDKALIKLQELMGPFMERTKNMVDAMEKGQPVTAGADYPAIESVN